MPTDEQRALWAGIRANPDDDTPRLVYADWLQEHGDEPRAEFIRAQCALSRLPYDRRRCRKQRKTLEAQERELLKAHKDRWTDELGRAMWADAESRNRWSAQVTFVRGFLRWVYLDLSAAVRLVASGHEPEPLGYLEVSHNQHIGTDAPVADVAAVAGWRFGHCVTTLSLARATDEHVRAVLDGGRLTRVVRLDLWTGSVGDAAVTELANSPLVGSVMSMCLSANKIGDAGALALAESPYLSDQCWLNVYSNQIGPEARARLRARFTRALQIEG